jgi:hypothetical protein
MWREGARIGAHRYRRAKAWVTGEQMGAGGELWCTFAHPDPFRTYLNAWKSSYVYYDAYILIQTRPARCPGALSVTAHCEGKGQGDGRYKG